MNQSRDTYDAPKHEQQNPFDIAADFPTDSDKGKFKRLLKNAPYRKLWVAGFVSSMGDWLIVGILVPMVLQLSGGSSMAVAGVMIAKILPALLLSSVTGAMVDRFSRRRIMITADVARLFLVLILLFTNSLPVIFIVLFLMETFSLFYWPARNALIPRLVQPSDVPTANSIMYTSQRVAMILGLALSGAIVRAFEQTLRFLIHLDMPAISQLINDFSKYVLQTRAGFFLDSFTFIISALLIISMGVASEKRPLKKLGLKASDIGRDALESIKFLGQHIELRALIVSISLAILGGGAIVPLGMSYIASLKGTIPLADSIAWIEALSASRQIFLLTFGGIGMAVGAFLVPRLEKKIETKLLFPGSIMLFSLGMIGFAFTDDYFAACLYAIGAGLCIAAVTVTGNNYIVENVSDELRGRVFSSVEAALRVSMLTAMVIMAPISDGVSRLAREGLHLIGVDEIYNYALTGPRVTILFAAFIVGIAGMYSFKRLYLDAQNEQESEHDSEHGTKTATMDTSDLEVSTKDAPPSTKDAEASSNDEEIEPAKAPHDYQI
jgi:dTMP kinase